MTVLDADRFPSVRSEPNSGKRQLLLCLHNSAAVDEAGAFADWYKGDHLAKLEDILGPSVPLHIYHAAPAPSWAGASFPWEYMTLIDLGDSDAAEAARVVAAYEGQDSQFAGSIGPDHAIWPMRAIGPLFRDARVDAINMDQLYFALTNPIPGERDDFHRWYETIHVPEVIEHLHEYVGAQRYIYDELDAPRSSAWEFITIYNVRASDVIAMQESIPAIAVKKFQPLQSILPDSAACTWTSMLFPNGRRF
ncbi:MAG: hypothetical protein AB7G25_05335 [Sphingomonadaceae bacterium]